MASQCEMVVAFTYTFLCYQVLQYEFLPLLFMDMIFAHGSLLGVAAAKSLGVLTATTVSIVFRWNLTPSYRALVRSGIQLIIIASFELMGSILASEIAVWRGTGGQAIGVILSPLIGLVVVLVYDLCSPDPIDCDTPDGECATRTRAGAFSSLLGSTAGCAIFFVLSLPGSGTSVAGIPLVLVPITTIAVTVTSTLAFQRHNDERTRPNLHV